MAMEGTMKHGKDKGWLTWKRFVESGNVPTELAVGVHRDDVPRRIFNQIAEEGMGLFCEWPMVKKTIISSVVHGIIFVNVVDSELVAASDFQKRLPSVKKNFEHSCGSGPCPSFPRQSKVSYNRESNRTRDPGHARTQYTAASYTAY
jgi:hypothetical protein